MVRVSRFTCPDYFAILDSLRSDLERIPISDRFIPTCCRGLDGSGRHQTNVSCSPCGSRRHLIKHRWGGTPAVAVFATSGRYKLEAYRASEFAPRVLVDNGIEVIMKACIRFNHTLQSYSLRYRPITQPSMLDISCMKRR